jgi:hypothetical protein
MDVSLLHGKALGSGTANWGLWVVLLCVKSPGKTWTSEENVNRIREAFQRSLHKSICAASLQLQIPWSIVHNVLHKRLRPRAYKIPALKPSDQVACTNFTVNMAERIDASPGFQLQVCSGEATFHVNGVVNRCNCGIWGSQNPHVPCKMEKGSPKVNVWVSLMHNKLIG